jgi:hypothetical protein
MKVKTRIELTEKDLAEIIAEKFKLRNVTVRVEQYNGDAREPSYTSITVEGDQN